MANLACSASVAVLLALASTACMHVTHPAEVKPGLTVDIAAGAGVAVERVALRDEPVEHLVHDTYDLQLGLRYGWRFTEEVALQVALVVPFVSTSDDGEVFAGPYNAVLVDGDIYLQIGDSPDWGIGVMGGLSLPRVYGMIGEAWILSPQVCLRVDASLGLGVAASIYQSLTPVVVPSVTSRLQLGRWDVGLYVGSGYAPLGVHIGEPGDSSPIKTFGGVSGGLLLAVRAFGDDD